jgi:hypothetical protein
VLYKPRLATFKKISYQHSTTIYLFIYLFINLSTIEAI